MLVDEHCGVPEGADVVVVVLALAVVVVVGFDVVVVVLDVELAFELQAAASRATGTMASGSSRRFMGASLRRAPRAGWDGARGVRAAGVAL